MKNIIADIDGTDVNGINTIKADETAGGKTYNVFGIEVDNNYRGIVIRNGKKFIQR